MIRSLLERLLLGPRPPIPAIGDRRSSIRWVPVTSPRLGSYLGHPVALGSQAATLSRVDQFTGESSSVRVVLQQADGNLRVLNLAVDVEVPVCVNTDTDGHW